jgi:hypothetical protein
LKIIIVTYSLIEKISDVPISEYLLLQWWLLNYISLNFTFRFHFQLKIFPFYNSYNFYLSRFLGSKIYGVLWRQRIFHNFLVIFAGPAIIVDCIRICSINIYFLFYFLNEE